MKKFEETINKYEDFTNAGNLDSIIKSTGLNFMKGIGMGVPGVSGMTGPSPVTGGFMSNTDYSKILHDMLKSSAMFGTDKTMNPNFMQDNFKNH